MSRNDGTTWTGTDKYVLVTTVQSSSDPLPVIQADYNANNKQVVYRTNQGLRSYITSTPYPSLANWTTTTPGGTSSSDFSPALTDQDNAGSSHTGLVYATTAGKIYYRYFNYATGKWSSSTNLSDIVPGSNLTHKEPTIAALPNREDRFDERQLVTVHGSTERDSVEQRVAE
jgi:hypothetical protein